MAVLPVLPVFPVFPVFPAFPVCVQDTTHGRWCMRLSSPHPPPPNPPSPTGREFSSCSSHCARAGVLFHLWPWKKTEQNTERNDEERCFRAWALWLRRRTLYPLTACVHVRVRMSATRGARGCLFPSLLILCSSRVHPPRAPSARCGLAARGPNIW